MDYTRQGSFSFLGNNGPQETNLIILDSTSVPSTPRLQPVIGMQRQTPTMPKKLPVFEDERSPIFDQNFNVLNGHGVAVTEIPRISSRAGNLMDDGHFQNLSEMQGFSGSVDQLINMENSAQIAEMQNLTMVEKLKILSSIIEPCMTDCYPNSPSNTFACDIVQLFNNHSLLEFQPLKGESSISVILKFIVGIPVHRPTITVTLKQEKQIHNLRSALFKECGFSLQASIIPVMCRRHKRSILHLRYSNGASLPHRLVALLKVKNKKGTDILLDSNSRVYRDLDDWRKHNTLVPSTVFVPWPNTGTLARVANNNMFQQSFSLREMKTPSCHASKMAFDVMDVAVGLGAVGAGVICFVTGGIALPVLLAGELAASIYMGMRGSMSLIDNRRHKPKNRR